MSVNNGKLQCFIHVLFWMYVLCSNSPALSVIIECVKVKECPIALKLIKTRPNDPNTIWFLRFSHCGFEGKEPKIWCNKFLYCKTPDSKDGICVNVRKCQPYLDLLQSVNVKDTVTKKYLREFRCNTEFEDKVEVCCPRDKLNTSFSPPQGGNDERRSTGVNEGDVTDRFADPVKDICGKQLAGDRIVGGTEAGLSEFPWMALLKYTNGTKTSFGCTGSLINSRYVLTAAHCVDPYITRAKNLGELSSVILGEYDLRNKTDCIYMQFGEDCADPLQEYEIESTTLHPGYDSSNVKDDIAIIKIKGRAKYSEYVRPICLPDKNLTFSGNVTFNIAGWGRTETERQSPVKRKAAILYRRRFYCNQVAGRFLNDGQICAGDGRGADSCFGDSGGPLMYEVPKDSDLVSFVVGIISYGYGGTCGDYPSVYTFVPYYIDWILDTIYS